jgi:DNA transposition AAA+ family ATPase
MTTIPFQPKKEEPASAAGSNNGSVSVEHYRRVAAALNEYKSNTAGVTWASLAREIGGEYSESSMSVFASGKYKCESARNIVEAVERFLSLVDERRQLITEAQYVPTSLSRRMLALIKKVVLLTKIGVIAAESGTGKTRTLQEYLISAPRSIYIMCDPTMQPQHLSVWPVLYRLLASLGVHTNAKCNQVIAMVTVIDKLRNTGRAIIFDEAQFLPAVALDLIRGIHEQARVPVILAGNETMYEGARSGQSSAAYVQFASRSLRERFGSADIKPADVDMIAEQLVGVELAKSSEKMLVDQARSAGGFRRLVTLLQIAQTLRLGNERITHAHVVRALDEVREQGGMA